MGLSSASLRAGQLVRPRRVNRQHTSGKCRSTKISIPSRGGSVLTFTPSVFLLGWPVFLARPLSGSPLLILLVRLPRIPKPAGGICGGTLGTIRPWIQPYCMNTFDRMDSPIPFGPPMTAHSCSSDPLWNPYEPPMDGLKTCNPSCRLA